MPVSFSNFYSQIEKKNKGVRFQERSNLVKLKISFQ